jgi:hypothetical protein
MRNARLGICVSMLTIGACSGKQRDFADGVVLPKEGIAYG